MKRVWQIGNIVSLIFALVANFLVGAQILNLPAINEVSDKYATLLTPANYAFSIWSLIYVLLIIFVIYQARDLFHPRKDNDLPEKIGPFFIIASVCNGLWTGVFVSDLIALSVILLLLLTGSLYFLLAKLRIAVDNPSRSVIACVWWPLLIYTGWVTIATIVNIASWLKSIDIMLSPGAVVTILIALAVGLIALLVKRNVRELVLACIWGLAAIGVQQIQLSGNRLVIVTVFSVCGILFIATVIHGYVNRHENIFLKSNK